MAQVDVAGVPEEGRVSLASDREPEAAVVQENKFQQAISAWRSM